MNTTRVRDWLKAPDTTAAEKALWVTALLTFFCMALGTAPPLIAGALAAGIWLFSGIAIKKRRIYRSSYWWPVLALILLIWIGGESGTSSLTTLMAKQNASTAILEANMPGRRLSAAPVT